MSQICKEVHSSQDRAVQVACVCGFNIKRKGLLYLNWYTHTCSTITYKKTNVIVLGSFGLVGEGAVMTHTGVSATDANTHTHTHKHAQMRLFKPRYNIKPQRQTMDPASI